MKSQIPLCRLALIGCLVGFTPLAFSERTRTLSLPETVHRIVLPVGTLLTESDSGDPIVAVLNTQLTLRSVQLPPNSRIAFFDDADFGIVDSTDPLAKPTVAFIGDGAGRILSNTCAGAPQYRSNIGYSDDFKAHFKENFSLSHMALSFHSRIIFLEFLEHRTNLKMSSYRLER